MPRQRPSYESARAITDALRQGSPRAPLLLAEAHTIGVARVLGYPSWRDYLRAELQLSVARAAELLEVAVVLRVLTAAYGEAGGEVAITRAQLAKVRPQLPAFTAMVAEAVTEGLTAEEALSSACAALPVVLTRLDSGEAGSRRRHPAGKAGPPMRAPEGASPSAPPRTRCCPVCLGHGFLVEDTP